MKKRILPLLAGASWLLTPAAIAQESESSSQEDYQEGSVSGGSQESLQGEVQEYEFSPTDLGSSLTPEEIAELPYGLDVWRGAQALQLEQSFVHDCKLGIDLIYIRDYRQAKTHWESLNRKYPGAGIGHVGNVLIYQSLMLENFDYKYESQYLFHSQQALRELEQSLETPGRSAWENFLMAGIIGIESIHTMRKGDFIPALTRGLEAVRYIKQVRDEAPDFADIILGDGLFIYWKSVVAMNSDLIPDGEDRRAEGIGLMRKAEQEATFVRPAATLALAFTWIEERDFSKALSACLKNNAMYPYNVINNLLTGRVYMYMRKHDQAIQSFLNVLSYAPDNQRVHYYLSSTYLRKKDYDSAHASVDRYLSFSLSEDFSASAWDRKGDIYYRQTNFKEARRCYEMAVSINGHAQSKARLDRMKKKRR